LRFAVRFRIHWLRLLLLLLLLTVGGGTLCALLLARAAPWALPGSRAISATLLAFLAFFHLPGDAVYRFYRTRALRDVLQLIASLQVSLSVAAGVEAAAAAGIESLATRALLGLVSANGGALLAEAGDLLLQGNARYAEPMEGPGPGTVLAGGGTLLYALVLRGPLGNWAGITPAVARVGLLLAVASANFFIPGGALIRGSSALLQRLVPGFNPIWHVEAALRKASKAELDEIDASPAPWPLDVGLWGYVVTSLRDLQERSAPAAAVAAGAGAARAKASPRNVRRRTPQREARS